MDQPALDVNRHVKYWRRCLTTLLPTEYTSTDSSRMALAFFILSALDILGVGAESLSEVDRAQLRDWILSCQHPDGGFCGSPNHKFPSTYYMENIPETYRVDPPNLAATFFAILSLAFVGGLGQIKRHTCLVWINSLQREDGSFGELLGFTGKIEGGKDMRYCLFAAVIRWVLRGPETAPYMHPSELINDINLEGLIGHIKGGQTYDGGVSESSEHEAHAGYTYCAVAALSLLSPNLLDKSHPNPALEKRESFKSTDRNLMDIPLLVRWLTSRQVEYGNYNSGKDGGENQPQQLHLQPEVVKHNEISCLSDDQTPATVINPKFYQGAIVGFNGRCNKRVDTCYTFWVSASLEILGESRNVDSFASRRFLLEETQHHIGGFGKTPGDPPDIYHSYLGLAALAMARESGLRELDSALCISVDAKTKLDEYRYARGTSA